MVFYLLWDRICAVMLSGAAGDQDQSDPGASVDRRDGDNLVHSLTAGNSAGSVDNEGVL